MDTAAAYGSEDAVGKGIKMVRRENIFVTTKITVFDHHQVEKAVKKSLQELDTDYIDLYLVGSYAWLTVLSFPCLWIRLLWTPIIRALPVSSWNTAADSVGRHWSNNHGKTGPRVHTGSTHFTTLFCHSQLRVNKFFCAWYTCACKSRFLKLNTGTEKS